MFLKTSVARNTLNKRVISHEIFFIVVFWVKIFNLLFVIDFDDALIELFESKNTKIGE